MHRFRATLAITIGVMVVCGSTAALAGVGNGAPSGPHFNLNVIGVSKDKTADMSGNNGHRIFVKLEGRSKIWLKEGDAFRVLDANGTDKDGAEFQLPDPFPNDDLEAEYQVWARPVGTPGGHAALTTCYVDGGVEICSLETLVLERKKGKPVFDNVSRELLTILVDTDGDGIGDKRMGIFDEDLWSYLWDYDNDGLKVLQLRFYPIPADLGD